MITSCGYDYENDSRFDDNDNGKLSLHITHSSLGIRLRTSSFFPTPIPIAIPTPKCTQKQSGSEAGAGIGCESRDSRFAPCDYFNASGV